jgi:putative ATP-binding cassette transporter
MKALRLLVDYRPWRAFFSMVSNALAGVLFATLIPLLVTQLVDNDSQSSHETDGVTQILVGGISDDNIPLLFFVICVLILIFRSYSDITLTVLALDIRLILRKKLYKQILLSKVSAVENIGSARLIQALTNDIEQIVSGAQLFPNLLSSIITLICMMAYLFILSADIFMMVLFFILVGVIVYQVPTYFGVKLFAEARDKDDLLQHLYNGLLGGIKELKINDAKQKYYVDDVLHSHEEEVRRLEIKGNTIFSLSDGLGSLISFLAIGALVFYFSGSAAVAMEEVIASVMILLYITGPVSVIINNIPQISTSNIAMVKFNQLHFDLPSEQINHLVTPVQYWKQISLDNVTYEYDKYSKNLSGFKTGPLNVTIKKGEITMIAGGNGSGKSTLAKLITQHYFPSSGKIFFDNNPINENNIMSFRQECSCIYSDYFVFDELLDGSFDDHTSFEDYLKVLGIHNQEIYANGKINSKHLSDGQRRRLALAIAVCESKPLILFDEWAADQDPEFKDFFYRQILPELKSQDKAVVVISHDDRYFSVADQLLFMDSGLIRRSEKVH